ncbi:MAG: VWA domain-containing protein [Eubacteriaceae bacterium]|nr:VWA domain-containing protein [Eubacteriaceae bacterium]
MRNYLNKTARYLITAAATIVLIICIISLSQNWNKKTPVLDYEAASKKIDSYYSKLKVNKLALKQDPNFEGVDSDAEKVAVLPDISEYPFIVNPSTDNFLTIYASAEKREWLIEIGNRFNTSGATIDGMPVSVSIRSMPSSLGADFISSGKYTPDLFSPSSEIYGEMIIGKGVNAALVEKRIAGNVTGIAINRKKGDDIAMKYGPIDFSVIAKAVLNGDLALGYTSPLSNEDGFNFVLALLLDADSENPTSPAAVEHLRKVQDRILLIAYDEDQLRASLTGGALDAIVINSQAYANAPNIYQAFEFIALGQRSDSPVYEIGELTELKKGIAELFTSFCKTPESQASATDKGFNSYEAYATPASVSGLAINQAQEIYKNEKGGSSVITAVFVADISGSMEGSPLLNLKASLSRAAGVISSDANIGLVTFSDDVNIALPIAKFDNNQRSYFSSAVKSMSAAGGTAMFDAIVVAQKMLLDAKMLNPNTKLMLFVLSDGESNRGLRFGDIEAAAYGTKIPIYTIGYNANIEVLSSLSAINEAAAMNADSDNVIYRLESLFNSQM